MTGYKEIAPARHRIASLSYHSGHPWYYKLGGKVPMPKQILASVRQRGYQGYRYDEIHRVDSKQEPDRSAALRNIRQECLKQLRANLAQHRELAREYHAYCRTELAAQKNEPVCSSLCTSMSLKYAHLYNDFAHLVVINDFLSVQPDLFDF